MRNEENLFAESQRLPIEIRIIFWWESTNGIKREAISRFLVLLDAVEFHCLVKKIYLLSVFHVTYTFFCIAPRA